jgi:hypothetical protein
MVKVCKYCGKEFSFPDWKTTPNKGQYCTMSCRAKATWTNRKSDDARYRCIRNPHHPLASKNGTVHEHRAMLYDKIGPGPHSCNWCGRLLDWLPGKKNIQGSITVDHLDNNGRNNVLDNLVASCHGCNCSRGRKDSIQDTELFITMKGNRGRHRAVERICKNCGKTFLHLKADKRPNAGQFCSKPCMYAGRKKHSTTP